MKAGEMTHDDIQMMVSDGETGRQMMVDDG